MGEYSVRMDIAAEEEKRFDQFFNKFLQSLAADETDQMVCIRSQKSSHGGLIKFFTFDDSEFADRFLVSYESEFGH